MKNTVRKGSTQMRAALLTLVAAYALFSMTAQAQPPAKESGTQTRAPEQKNTTQADRKHTQELREALGKASAVSKQKAQDILNRVYNPWKQVSLLPDLVVAGVQACRSPTGHGRVDWDILVTAKNVGGNDGITTWLMPVRLVVEFDPKMPWGQATVGDAGIISEAYEAWMQVPVEPGGVRSWRFLVSFADPGPCQNCNRQVPKEFAVFVDTTAAASAVSTGVITESNELNNGSLVPITNYDQPNGYSLVPQWCYY